LSSFCILETGICCDLNDAALWKQPANSKLEQEITMVNIGGSGWNILLALVLVAGSVGLGFLRSIRPSLARDYDIFFAAVGLFCGGILFFQGWRLDPILQFSQFLLTGTAFFFVIENLRLRGISVEQAKRDLPIVDEDRPVSRVYRAEFDEANFYEERPTRRIRGSRDSRPSGYDDDYYPEEQEPSRRRSSSRNGSSSSTVDRLDSGERPRKRRPRPEGRASESSSVEQDYDRSNRSDEQDYAARPSRRGSGTSPNSAPGNNRSSTRNTNNTATASRPRRSRPNQDSEAPPASKPQRDFPADEDYVDYRPVNNLDDEEDNSANFD
jgi:Ycf66 protein N-terminus